MAKCIRWNARGQCILREGEEGTEKEEDLAHSVMQIDEEGRKFSKASNARTADDSFMRPGEQEQALLDLIGEEGMNELRRLFDEGFTLDETTRGELDRLREARLGASEVSLDRALDQAIGRATSGAAGRGLAQGSTRAELTARLSDPAIARFQRERFNIEAQDAQNRISLPRTDFGIRQQALASPALTALQRNRLSNAELRLRLAGLNLQQQQMNQQSQAGFGNFVGRLVGTGVGAMAGGPAGAAIGGNIGGSIQGDASAIGSPGYNTGGSFNDVGLA